MTKKYSRIRLPVITLAFVVMLAVAGVVAALQLAKNPDYWLSGAGLVVAVILPITAHVVRGKPNSSPGKLNKVTKELAAAVQDQWSRNVARITDPYPLEVPFSVMTTATVDPAAAQPSPPDRPIPVMDTWPSIRDQRGAGPLVLDGAFKDIATVFTSDALHRRMVILGEPGSGKSMIAQWLTVELLKSHPELGLVPVVLSLATWDPDDPLEEWAAAEMAKTYPSLHCRAGGRQHGAHAGLPADQRESCADGSTAGRKPTPTNCSRGAARRRSSIFCSTGWSAPCLGRGGQEGRGEVRGAETRGPQALAGAARLLPPTI